MSDPIRVLHVEDRPDFADLTVTALERENDRLAVETATCAREGLERLTDGVDCVVSDYDMPERTGIDFLEAVRDRYPDLPFILFTGKGSEEVASEAISAGVTDYLEKGGGISQFTVLANRITNAVEQYRSKRALEANQRRLSLFVEQSPLGVVEWDEDFDVVSVNEAGEEILGYAEAELIGASWEAIVPESETEPVGDVVAALLKDRGGYRSVNENVRADGERIVCEWHNRVVTDDDDEVVAIFSQFQDVTERSERETRLGRSSARLEALFENSPDMINVHDTDGNILDPNRRLCEKTGYDATDLTGMKVWDLDQSIDPAQARAIWAEMAVGDRRRLEGVYRRRDGSTFPVEIHIQRLDLAGTDRFVAISRDISERVAREEELQRQNERLEEFVGVVSHDLQSPLNVAEGRLELARETYDDVDLEEAAHALERMNELIDDLLDNAREGERSVQMETVSLADAVEDSWRDVATADARLVVETTRTIRADPDSLRRLLVNLLQNAVEHSAASHETTEDDVPTVTVGDVEDCQGFYVADDGDGIAASDREAIFRSGYSTAVDGTGFGLAIVESVAETHGWEIRTVESDATGARFELVGIDVVD